MKQRTLELKQISRKYLEKNSQEWEEKQSEIERKQILNLARHETKKAQIKQIEKKIREGMHNVPVDKKIKQDLGLKCSAWKVFEFRLEGLWF